MARLVIDPVTRAGGHLRIEADLAGGAVREAWSSGTMFRGVENVIRGRDPREAWLLAQRVCGTCNGVHALASVRAVERAFGIAIPTNARLVRNVLAATQLVRDHVLSFYQAQAPDWVDAQSALTADPAATSALARSVSGWPRSAPDDFAEVRDRLAAAVDGDHAGPFGTGWWGHPAYRLTPETNLLLLAHLIEALEWQRRLMQVNALFGGKDPHPQTFLVGGMSLAAPWGGPEPRTGRGHPDVPQRGSPDPLSDGGLDLVASRLTDALTFVDQVLLPDIRLLAAAYPEWGSIGAGPGGYLAFGEYPEDDAANPVLFLPRGRVRTSNPGVVEPVDEANVAESVDHAWYRYDTVQEQLPPAGGQTTPSFDASLPLSSLEGATRYSWVKAARYNGEPMETGALARLMVASVEGRADIRTTLSAQLGAMGLGPDVLPSVLGRIVARGVEARVVASAAQGWLAELREHLATGDLAVANIGSWDPESWPSEVEAWSLGEGPRGAVGHWVAIRDRVIDRYQVVDGSTWNASPRDAAGVPGPLEAALVGVAVADPARPLEVLRVVHSFNPCVACAAHVFGSGVPRPLDIRVRKQEVTR